MRDFAQVRLSIWNDDDFRGLSPSAQHLFFVLFSHPSMSYAGVGDWRPKRIAKLASGWQVGAIEAAANELIEKFYILVDEDTEEYLIRSFVRNDPLLKQPKLSVSMARAFSVVASDVLRGVIVFELRRLRDDRPELAAWNQNEAAVLLDRDPINPRDYPLGKGLNNPCVRGSFRGSFTPNGAQDLGVSLGGYLGVPYNSNSNIQHTTHNFQQLEVDNSNHKGGRMDEDASPNFPEAESDPADADRPAPGITPAQWCSPDDPRCWTHRNHPADGPCHQCGEVRKWFARDAEREKNTRRAAIDECPHCDERGMVNIPIIGGGAKAARCTHAGSPAPANPPDKHSPQASKKTRQKALQALKRKTHEPPF